VYTDETNDFDHVVLSTERKYFDFTVKACHSIHVILTHSPGVVYAFAYDVVIGTSNNTMSVIRKLSPNGMEREFVTDKILSCAADTTLWMTWNDGIIRVGIGSTEHFSWTDDDPYSINALSLASRDSDRVSWQFSKDSGNFAASESTDIA
jgi:hypothetical protein